MGILGVVLAIIGLLVALFGTLLFGNACAIASIVLGVLAGVLGILKRKKEGKGGIPAIVIGVLAIILAVTMMTSTQNLMKGLKDEMVKASGDKYQVARKYASEADTNSGIFGLITSMINKAPEEERDQLQKELSDVFSLLSDSLDGTKENVEEKIDDAKEKIEEKVDEAGEKLDEAGEKIDEAIDDAGEKIDETIEQVIPDGGNT